jgi:hypothetical protein
VVRQHTPVLPSVLRMASAVSMGLLFCWRKTTQVRERCSKQSKQAGKGQPAAAGERAKGSVTRRAWVLVKQFGSLCVGVCRGCVGGGLVCRNAIPCLFSRQGARLAVIARLACPDPSRHTPLTVTKR